MSTEAIIPAPRASLPTSTTTTRRDLWLAIAFYTACTTISILATKHIVALFPFGAVLMASQSVVASIALYTIGLLSPSAGMRAFDASLARRWLPVAIVFGVLNYSIANSLASISVSVFYYVFKNVTTILTALGNWALNGEGVSYGVLASIVLMAGGSLLTGLTDLSFDSTGYVWVALHAVMLAVYVLLIKHIQSSNPRFSDWEQTFYSNFLGAFVMIAFGVASRETVVMWEDAHLYRRSFWLLVLLTGLLRACVGFSIFRLMSLTSPVTYTMVNALNNIPGAVLSAILFPVAATWQSSLSIALALISGVIFAYARAQD